MPILHSTTPVRPGDRVAVLSPAWAAPAYFPAIHEQALARIESKLGLIPVEYPTTRKMGATARERAADVNAAFADPSIRAIFASIGGDDQITVTPFLDPSLAQADPKPFFGYSDNTNIHNWLWRSGVQSFYGGATQLHFGSGSSSPEPEHLATLRSALFKTGDLVLPLPSRSQDYALDWSDPQAVTMDGAYGSALPLEFLGSDVPVRGRTWGGCCEVLDQLAIADRLPSATELEGAILILETSEVLPPPDFVGRWVRAMGERGYLHAVQALMFARPAVDDRSAPAPPDILRARHHAYIDYLLSSISLYRKDLLVCLNLPFGHTKPQVVIPYGGEITIDPVSETVTAHFR